MPRKSDAQILLEDALTPSAMLIDMRWVDQGHAPDSPRQVRLAALLEKSPEKFMAMLSKAESEFLETVRTYKSEQPKKERVAEDGGEKRALELLERLIAGFKG